jgi:nucleoside-diphosphate-sugar epimerase
MNPYGVTKLAAEHLCGLYGRAYGVPTISLRYFTVYGPRQRPDMAMHRLIESALTGSPFPLNGAGTQVRDFTFVDDAVEANVLAAAATTAAGTVCNIGGGAMTGLSEIIATVEELTGRSVPIEHLPAAVGDPYRTGADTHLAAELLGWRPQVTIAEGLRRQVAWHTERRSGVRAN